MTRAAATPEGRAVTLPDPLHPALRLALAWQPAAHREMLATLFLFDERLGTLVASASEPVLGQLRLAWWRERLSEAPGNRPRGDPVLDAIGVHWAGSDAALGALVDGWEELLGDAPLSEISIAKFADARASALAAFARTADGCSDVREVADAGKRWALADFALRTSHPLERDRALGLTLAIAQGRPMPRSVRGVAVLDALARRSIERGEPLCHGRGAAITALRVGIFRR